MRRTHRPQLRHLVGALIAIAVISPVASASATKPNVTKHMYNDRYCEILAVKGAIPNLVADVWNTYGLNDCPPDLWAAQDATALGTELGALAIRLNGPRYWLIDNASIRLADGMGEIRKFSGLKMREIAQVQVPITNGVPGLAPYTQTTVLRDNTFTWSRDHRVNELVDPDGNVYVMQAYSQIVDPTLTLGDLSTLRDRLALPADWRYRTRKLRHDLSLTTTGKAKVVQDELMNTYQFEHKG